MGKLSVGMGATIATLLVGIALVAAPRSAEAMYAGTREITCTDYGQTAVTIDDTTWIVAPYSECTEVYIGGGGGGGGGYTYYEPAPGGGGGGGIALSEAPDRDNNPNPATCKSSGFDRYLHIIYDFGGWKAEHAPTRLTGKGELIQFTYDDGGVELYVWIPGGLANSTAPPETYLARVPNTLRCPQ